MKIFQSNQQRHLLLLLIVFSIFNYSAGEPISRNTNINRIPLDPQGKFQLGWNVDYDNHRIYFDVLVATTGYIAFGFAKTPGNLDNTDFFLGGVNNGITYYSDQHILSKALGPQVDRNDWEVHSSSDDGTFTNIRFSTLFVTCDVWDLPVTPGTMNLIYAYSDQLDQSNPKILNNIGFKQVKLLDDTSFRAQSPCSERQAWNNLWNNVGHNSHRWQ